VLFSVVQERQWPRRTQKRRSIIVIVMLPELASILFCFNAKQQSTANRALPQLDACVPHVCVIGERGEEERTRDQDWGDCGFFKCALSCCVVVWDARADYFGLGEYKCACVLVVRSRWDIFFFGVCSREKKRGLIACLLRVGCIIIIYVCVCVSERETRVCVCFSMPYNAF